MRRSTVLIAIGALSANVVVMVFLVGLGRARETARQEARRKSGFPRGAQTVEGLFGGADGLGIVSNTERVTAERIAPPKTDGPRYSPLGDFRATAGPIAVPSDLAQTLSTALVASESYRWTSRKRCVPSYGVRLSFFQGAGRVDVYLCFSCNVLAVARNGKPEGEEDFDDVRPVFVRAAKKLFPADAVIQRLPEHGCTGDD